MFKDSDMSKFRSLKLRDYLRDNIGRIIIEEMDFEEDVLVTVIRTELTKKLGGIDVFISVYPTKYGENIIEQINKRLPYLQMLLRKKMRIKSIPRMRLVLDKGDERVARIEELLHKNI